MTDDGADPTLAASQIGVAQTTPASDAKTLEMAMGKLPARYALGRPLGIGGMGEVVLATDSQIGRDVAIKRMRVEPTSSAVARFLREAKIQGRLDHPAIVPVHELATDEEGRPFFVMKRLTGTTLAEIIANRTQTPQKLLRAFADVCLAIEFAHSRGIIHRDLKPANVMLGDFGEVYVLDWGIARVTGEVDDVDTAPAPSGDVLATEAGAVLGTPGYMAPEQLRGEPLDGRADVYALGCILFEIVAGESLLPRGREALKAVFEPIDARPSQRAVEREVPPELDELCVAATRLDRNARPSARELAERIERYLDGDRDLAQRKSLAAAHLAAARASLEAGDGETERATAMREAGRAIALDPRGTEAVQLVGRLVLEPPRVVPPEVDERVAALEEATSRKKARLQTVVLGSFLLFIPVFFWMGVRSYLFVGVYATSVILECLLVARVGWQKRPITPADTYFIAAINAIPLAVVARLFSPFLIAPVIVALAVMLFVLDSRLRWQVIMAISVAAVLVPWLLEFTGVVPRTMGTTVAGDLVLHSDLVVVTLPKTEIALAGAFVSMIAFGGFTARNVALAHREAMRSVELQAWHLRQLVKSPPG